MTLQFAPYALKSSKHREFCLACIYFVTAVLRLISEVFVNLKRPRLNFHVHCVEKKFPAPNNLGKPDKWAYGLPFCEIIEKIVKIRERKLCLPCQ